MRLFSAPPRARARWFGCLAVAACALGLSAQQAAAAPPAFVQSSAPLGFPANAATSGGSWYLYGTACDGGHSCVTAGYYTDRSGNTQGYVVPIVDGVAGTPEEVTPPANADADPHTFLYGVACSSNADVCEAYGTYNVAGQGTPLVVRISHGVPDQAIAVGLPYDIRNAPTGYDFLFINGIDCASAADCVAVGDYQNASGNPQPLVLPIVDGTPQSVVAPQLPRDHASSPNAVLNSVACQPSGTCAAVGYYRDSGGVLRGLAVPISDGVAGAGARISPGDGASDPEADIYYVGCPATGACQSIGSYTNRANVMQSFVTPLVDGLPGTPTAVSPPAGGYYPGNAALAANGLSCSSATLCVAAGSYQDPANQQQAAVVPITPSGATIQETSLPAGADPVNPDGDFYGPDTVGCVPAGPCLASGYYGLANNGASAAGLVEAVSTTGTPGPGVLTDAPADLSSTGTGSGPVSGLAFGAGCGQSGSCVATGEYENQAGSEQPYLVSLQAPLSVSTASLAPATQGAEYQATLAATGAWGSYSWSVASGSLPAGLSLNPQTGVISGTPAGAGTATFTVQVAGTGSPAQTAVAPLSIAVAAQATPASVTTVTRMTTVTTMPTLTTTATPASAPHVTVLRGPGKVIRGRAGVTLGCAAAACIGTVKLQTRVALTVKRGKKRVRRYRRVVIGLARFSTAVGLTSDVSVPLNRGGERLLALAKGQRLTVELLVSAAGGNQDSRRSTIWTGAKHRRR